VKLSVSVQDFVMLCNYKRVYSILSNKKGALFKLDFVWKTSTALTSVSPSKQNAGSDLLSVIWMSISGEKNLLASKTLSESLPSTSNMALSYSARPFLQIHC
jgi:hypothetical protein